MLPFFSRKRLVIVEDADPFISKHRKDLEALYRQAVRVGHSAAASQDLGIDHQAGDDSGERGPSDQLHQPERR